MTELEPQGSFTDITQHSIENGLILQMGLCESSLEPPSTPR